MTRAARVVVGFVSIVVIGLAWFEVVMRPSGPERLQLGLLFGAMAAASGVAAWVLPRWAAHSESVRRTSMVLSMTAVVIVAGGVGLAASRMFLSSHDLTVVLVVLGVGVLAGVGFALAVARPWTDDLNRMAATAERVATGDFAARSGVTRRDEIGHLAGALDTMAVRLAAAEEDRSRDERSRREFLAAIGHDLRTPLSALQAALEALRDGMSPDPERYLRSMEHDVAALRSLVDDLFLLAKIESGSLEIEPAPVDLTEVADEAIEVLRPMAAVRGISLRLDTTGRAIVSGGPEALSRVMRNLLDNAIRYAPDRSEVLVRVTNGEGATVAVTDQGPGFDPAFVERAFSSFQRSDPARARDTGGAGLGLAIAQGFVSAMGGTIWADPGPGGKVSFRLPVTTAAR
ncbi:MAG TPA: HAMP domain-containing sensor histidine kinase [Acidimicrobiia bacterium]|jgi:signal transduction histidine kinase